MKTIKFKELSTKEKINLVVKVQEILINTKNKGDFLTTVSNYSDSVSFYIKKIKSFSGDVWHDEESGTLAFFKRVRIENPYETNNEFVKAMDSENEANPNSILIDIVVGQANDESLKIFINFFKYLKDQFSPINVIYSRRGNVIIDNYDDFILKLEKMLNRKINFK